MHYVTYVYLLNNNNNNNNNNNTGVIIIGPINSSGISFLVQLGRRLTDVSGDARETMYFSNEFLWRSSATIR